MSARTAKAARRSGTARKRPAAKPVEAPVAPVAGSPDRQLRFYKIVGSVKAQIVNAEGKPVGELDVAQVELYDAQLDSVREAIETKLWPSVLAEFAPEQAAAEQAARVAAAEAEVAEA